MANFGKLIVTNAGKETAAKIKADETKTFKFKKIHIGDGELGGQNAAARTELVNKTHEIDISTVSVIQENIVSVSFQMQNFDTQEIWREIGVTIEDPDTKEDVLYIYGNAGDTPEIIPARGGADVLEKFININMAVENAGQISVELGTSLVYVSEQEFRERIEEINKKIEELSTDYSDLTNKPAINGQELTKDTKSKDLKIKASDITNEDGETLESKLSDLDKTIENNTPIVKAITLEATKWQQSEETQYWEYDVKDETVTSNHKVYGDMDIANQEKIEGNGYTETYDGGYKIRVTEKPEEEVSMEITIMKMTKGGIE